MSTSGNPLSLYFHIPFCRHKCPYCHFFVMPYDKDHEEKLFEGLFLEWEETKSLTLKSEVISLYFGGGTPSLVNPALISKLIEKVTAHHCPTEITLEVNPEDVTASLCKQWKEIGINRISLGAQTLNDKLLQFLERNHRSNKVKEALFLLSKFFHNISIDLIFELPYQTLKVFEETLHAVQDLPITHLSLYNLSYEKGSSFEKKKHMLIELQPTPEVGADMLHIAVKHFSEIGLNRYEISAFAKDGFKSLHNLGYWTDRTFLGYGPSAFSYFDGRRYRNHRHLQKWLNGLKNHERHIDFEETLPYMDHIKEKIAIGLRVLEGIKKEPFPEEIQTSLSTLENEGFLRSNERCIKLTEKGLLYYDYVAEKII